MSLNEQFGVLNLTSFFLRVFFLVICTPTVYAQVELDQNELNYYSMVLSDEALSESLKLADKIRELYPTSEYLPVYIGRSLSIVSLINQEKGYSGVDLPFSGRHVDLNPKTEALKSLNERVFQHLDQHLPSLKELEGRKIVLLDFSVSGGTLKTAKTLMERFYGAGLKVHTFEVKAFLNRLTKAMTKIKEPFLNKHTYYLDEDSILYKGFLDHSFNRLSPYRSFLLSRGEYKSVNEKASEELILNYGKTKKWVRSKLNMGISSYSCKDLL